MAQVLHGSARTTATVRRAIQNSQASIRSLAQQYTKSDKQYVPSLMQSKMQSRA